MSETRICRRLPCAVVLLCGVAAALPAAGQQEQVDAAGKKLIAASGFFRREEYDLAAQEYAEFLSRYGSHKEATSARYGLGICRYRLEQYAEAAKLLGEVLREKRFKQRDEALAVLGHCWLTTKAYDKAVAAFDELLSKHRDSSHVEFAGLCRLQALYLAGDARKAADAARAFLKKHPASGHRAGAGYYLAMSLSSLGDHAGAAKTLADLLSKYPNSPYAVDARLLLGQCLERQGDLGGAAKQYRDMIRAAPPTRQAEAYYSLGFVLYKAGEYDDCIKQLQVVLSRYSTSEYAAPARLQLALAQVAGGHPDQARKTLAVVAAKDKARAGRAKYWLAQCDIAEKKYAPARAALETLSKAKPLPSNIEEIRYDMAVCAAALGRHDRAAEEFAAFVRQHPDSKLAADALYRQAFSLHKLEKYAESLAVCRKIASGKASAVTLPAAALAAENLFLAGKYTEAAGPFRDLAGKADSEGKKLRYRLRLGQCAYFVGDFAAAVEHLKDLARSAAVAGDPTLREAVFLLGDAHLQLKQHAQAAEWLGKYLSLGAGRKLEANYKCALAQLRAGQKAEAKKLFTKLAKGQAASPWVVRGMYEYGQFLYDEGAPASAAKVLAKVLGAKPPKEIAAASMYLLAWIDADAKKFDTAARRFRDMAAAHPDHKLAGEAAFQHGVCLKEAGKNNEAAGALEAYLKSHRSGEHAQQARRLLATCLAEAGKHGDAAERLAALAGDRKTCTDAVLYDLAWAYRELRQADSAVKAYRRLLAEFPKSGLITQVRAELAELLDVEKKYADAAELLEKVVADTSADAETRSVALYRLGLCWEKLGKMAAAAAAFGRFASEYPKDENAPSAMYKAGAAYAGIGKFAEAQKHLAALLQAQASAKKKASRELDVVARLKLGEVQGAAGEYEKSAATYMAFLQKYTKPASKYAYLARFGVGWAMENRKKYDDARTWYAQVAGTHNGPTAARAQFQIGECYFAEGKYDQAARELMKVDIVYAYPEWSAPALYDAGRAFEQLRQTDKARKQYELCIQKYKDSAPAGLAATRLKALGAKQ